MPVPGKRELPIHDETHVKLAWDMVDRTKGLTNGERAEARTNIKRRAKELGMDTSGWGKVKAEMVLWCMSLDVPTVAGHPNRMPFSGVLTKIGLASDQPPHGANGKRVLLTHDAAEKALASLLGMGVDLTAELDGHDAQNKVGVITGAHIEGEDLKIEGFIYAADFPNEALRIHLKQSELGFSFEAQNLAVKSLDADPSGDQGLRFHRRGDPDEERRRLPDNLARRSGGNQTRPGAVNDRRDEGRPWCGRDRRDSRRSRSG